MDYVLKQRDQLAALAALPDRLTHRAQIPELVTSSYRLRRCPQQQPT